MQQPMGMSAQQPPYQPTANFNNQPSLGAPVNPGYAHGGRVRKAPLTAAHMSKHELEVMDHLQGGTEKNRHGARCYSHLEELLKNPHLRMSIHHHGMEHKMAGGEVDHMTQEELHRFRENGRNGDDEVAMIGPHTHHYLNMMAGHSTRNPHDGHPEYFSLGSALTGLWKGVKGAGSAIGRGAASLGRSALAAGKAAAPTLGAIGAAATPALANIASEHLQKHLGDAGGMLGQLGGALGQSAFGKLAGPGQNPIGTAIGEGLGKFSTAAHSGEGMRSAIGQGLAHTGSQFGGDNAAGNVLSSVGQGLQSGQSAGDILRGAGAHATQGGISALMAGKGNRRSALLPSAQGMMEHQQSRLNDMSELPYYGEQ
jgi:hypothetical protein